MKAFFDNLSTIADVQALIDATERESDVLDYKKASNPFGNTNEISKDVSAFANSSGGVMIFGVSTDDQDKTKPVKIEGVHHKNRETFDRVVNSQIRPLIKGIQVKMIPPDSPKVMVVYVPQSDEAPHQNGGDNKYYRRSGVESLPMSHDLVALYFGRRSAPVLSLRFDPITRIERFDGDPAMSNHWQIRVFIENTGKRVAKYVKVLLYMLKEAATKFEVYESGHTTSRIDHLHKEQYVVQFTENDGLVHPNERTAMFKLQMRVAYSYAENHGQDPFIKWRIYCDEMEAKEGSITLAELRNAGPTRT
jgi:hypothetical protein